MKNKLLSNTIYLYVLTFAKMVFPLLTLPYLTRVLSLDTYGCVTYVKSFVSYIQLAIDYGFLLSATKNIALLYNKDNDKIGEIVGNTIVEKCIIAVVMCFVTVVVICFVPILQDNKLFTWLYVIAICINVFLPDYLYRGIEKMQYIAIPYTCSKAVVVIFTFALIKSDGDLLLIPILEILGNALSAAISIYLFSKLKIKLKIGKVKTLIHDLMESGVYFLSNFATTFFGSLTTIIAGIYLDLASVAYWGVCMQIVSAAKAMYTPITNSIYPHMVKNKEISLVKKISFFMFIPMILGSVVVMLFGGDILAIIGGKNYYEAGRILKLLLPVIVASFYSMLYGWPVLGAIGKVKETTISTIISALIQLLGLGILIVFEIMDLETLAISCCVAEVSLLVIRYYIYYKNKSLFGT